MTREDRQKVLDAFIEMINFSCSNCKFGPADDCKRIASHLQPAGCIMVDLRMWPQKPRGIVDGLSRFLNYIKEEPTS